MTTLNQPADFIFDQFDQLIVLDPAGQIAFHGPRQESLGYFEKLLEISRSDGDETLFADSTRPSGMSSTEFILMVTHHLSKAKTPGKRLNDRFMDSTDGKDFEVSCGEAVRAVEAGWKSNGDARDVEKAALIQPEERIREQIYVHPFAFQLRTLLRRKYILISRNPVTIRRIFVAIAFGCVTGSLFSALAADLIGGLARGGFLFLSCFLVLMLSCGAFLFFLLLF